MALWVSPYAGPNLFHDLVAIPNYAQVGSAFASAVNTSGVVTITDPGTASPFSKATDIYIYAIVAGYSAATTGAMTVKQGSLATAWTINVSAGSDQPQIMPPWATKFPAGSGNVVVTLPAGGANTTNGLLVFYGISSQ